MKKAKWIRFVLIILFACTFFVLDLYLWIEAPRDDETEPWISNCFMFLYLSLALMFTIVILRLNGVMNRMTGSFAHEIRSVNCQFFVFLVAYLTRNLSNITFEFTNIFSEDIEYASFLVAAGIS